MATITFRTDDEVERALRSLMERTGADKSTAIRKAILTACRESERQRLREESARLAEDDADRAAIRRAQEDMAPLRAW